jgi:sialate O-acetylesterase
MINLRFRLFVVALLLLAGISSSFGLTLPHVFGDHMVLQTGQAVPVWGWAKPGESITVSFAAHKNKTTAAAGDGHWEVDLDPLAVSAQPAQMTVTGEETVTFKDVLVGEVWLCSGQSNMEKPLGEQEGQKPTFNYEEELKAANYPEIRLLKIPKTRVAAPARDVQASWARCSPASLDQLKFSAAGYFFARKLHHELNVPIGVIDSSFGGTRIELWISPRGFAGVPSLSDFAAAATTPGAKVNDTDISTLYNGMIHPLVPFALHGVLWYQGEANVYFDYGTHYADKMTALVDGWRGEWKEDFPFYYVQIAPMLYHIVRWNKVVSPEAEPRIWEAQAASMRIPRTGMVVVTDLVDDLFDFHPRDKKDVGERLAAWALANDYGRKGIEVSGPLFHSMEVDGTKAVLHFDHVGGGLVSKDGLPLTWFDVAGADGRFYPGTATIAGDTVVVTAPQVATPAVVRFAWDEGARANLANKAGLPASPFRTDNPFLQLSGAKTGGP